MFLHILLKRSATLFILYIYVFIDALSSDYTLFVVVIVRDAWLLSAIFNLVLNAIRVIKSNGFHTTVLSHDIKGG
ncbi:hypothetical protein AAD001_02150 [Colwelliaceae bacterium 6471]